MFGGYSASFIITGAVVGDTRVMVYPNLQIEMLTIFTCIDTQNFNW